MTRQYSLGQSKGKANTEKCSILSNTIKNLHKRKKIMVPHDTGHIERT